MPWLLTPYENARLDGIHAAQREHRRLGSNFESGCPIFDVIEDARIWLFFQPLHNLYGAYMRDGDAPGSSSTRSIPSPCSATRPRTSTAITSSAMQRAPTTRPHLPTRRQSLQEVAAQAFAGEFLMPLQLVNYTLRTMGLSGTVPALVPRQVYQLALELGVSYSAAVTQLVGQRKLTVDAGQRLRKMSPLAVKTGLAGIRPANSWADVWLLDESQEGRQFVAAAARRDPLMLRETPSTGYVWEPIDVAPSILELVDDRFESDDGGHGVVRC